MIFEKTVKRILIQKFFSEDFKKLELINKFDNIDFSSIEIIQEADCFNSDNLKSLFTLHYYGNNSIVDEFQSILTQKVYMQKLDLKMLNSISASKSKGPKRNFKTLFEFGLANNIDYANCLHGLTSEALKHSFTVDRYNWCNKLEWNNSGTSHRVASLIYHLFCNKQAYTVNMEITEYDLDRVKLKKIFLSQDVFILNLEHKNEISGLLFKSGILNKDIITVDKGKSLVYIFIEKSSDLEENSNIIIDRLKELKETKVLYVNDYIESLYKL